MVKYKQSRKRLASALLAALIMLCGCAVGCSNNSDAAVMVESVASITGVGSTSVNSRYAGVVTSNELIKVTRDSNQKIAKLNCAVGDTVRRGEVLFSYDVQGLKLSLDKLKIEKEQLEALLKSMSQQKTALEKQIKTASSDTKLQLNVELQQLLVDQKEAENSLANKKDEITETNRLINNVNVTSPVTGTVKSISQEDSGSDDAYITIVENESYRVKCKINELNLYSIYEGMPVVVRSRLDSSAVWEGTVSMIDTSEPEGSENAGEMYYGYAQDEMTSTSNYYFYISLDSTDGLILGQHVYTEPGTLHSMDGIWLPAYYICEPGNKAWVWAANKRGKLTKRYVELGEYDVENDCYQILDGLTPEDLIAFPSEECVEGVSTSTYYDEGSAGEYTDDYTGDENYDEYNYDGMDGMDGTFEGDLAMEESADQPLG